MIKDGWVQFGLRMSPQLYELVRERAADCDMTINGWIRHAMACELGVELYDIGDEASIRVASTRSSRRLPSRRKEVGDVVAGS